MGSVFNPAGKPLRELEIVALERDELEVLYLCDGQDLHQDRAGEMMGVSRGTVQRLLASARKKLIEVVVGQKALVIVGEMPKVEVPDVGLTIDSNHEGGVARQGYSSCGSNDSEPCQGPLSCPWRR
ncbi:MAG TPA: DUF134 domain-containing protein [Geomobilimonas sp.]|nr:DUF134 domain-containing protein [Geomobilimonas sp.]